MSERLPQETKKSEKRQRLSQPRWKKTRAVNGRWFSWATILTCRIPDSKVFEVGRTEVEKLIDCPCFPRLRRRKGRFSSPKPLGGAEILASLGMTNLFRVPSIFDEILIRNGFLSVFKTGRTPCSRVLFDCCWLLASPRVRQPRQPTPSS